MAKRFSIAISLRSSESDCLKATELGFQSYHNLNSSLEELEKSELLISANSGIIENACADVKNKEHHVICGCQWSSILITEFFGNYPSNVCFFHSIAFRIADIIP